jgi:putative transcriptional regulator
MRARDVFTLIGCCLLIMLPGAAPVRASIPVTGVPDMPQQTGPRPAPGMFLVARRGFSDPFFSQAVVWLLQHDETATFGVIINRPLQRRLADVATTVRGSWLQDLPVFHGGPVDRDMLVMLVRGAATPELSRHVTADVHASIHGQMLNELLVEPRPADTVRFFLGHAGWVPGQLEAEIKRGSWRLLEGDVGLVFAPDTSGLWEELIERIEPAADIDIPRQDAPLPARPAGSM